MINRKHLIEVASFAAVGGLATVTHYVVGLLLVEQAGWDVYLANVFAYVTALGVSYFGHSIVTFRVALNRAVFAKFVGCSVAVFLLSQVMLWLSQIAFSENHRISLAVVVLFIPVISYLVNKFIVYRR